MIPRPRVRLPLWSVPLIVAALYCGRSLMRGSWRPDLPMDAVLLVMVAVVMVAVWRLRTIESESDDASYENGASRDDAEGPPI